jgi:type II restriction enzyme
MPEKPFLHHVKSSADLVTTYEATRSGFLEMAIERNVAGNPFIEQAKILRSVAQKTTKPQDLLEIDSLQAALITAAGFSDKARKYILPEDQIKIITEFINKFLVPAGDSYKDELVYRFLLTRGDSIGGSLRNLAGKLAQKKVNKSIISAFELFQIPFYWHNKEKNSWTLGDKDIHKIEYQISGFSWSIDGKNRTLVFNYLVPAVGNNIDLCLVNCTYTQIESRIGKTPESFIALGELKGGIDPAGSDEHWKTARTAFTRIRQAFSEVERFPNLFFIGAAIEKSMAEELWNQLHANTLTNAANLTNADQLSSLVTWLINL